MKKITFANLRDSPIWIIIIIVAASVTATYSIMTNIIVEPYKLENQRLEKIIDQRDKLNNLDSVANSLRNILNQQIKIVELKHSKNQTQIQQNVSVHKWGNQINNTIIKGENLLKLNPEDKKTFDSLNLWRNECISMLKQIDIELKTTKNESDFTTLTRIDMAQYPQLYTKITDGINILKTVKQYY